MGKKRLLFLGDSLTAGVYSDGKMRYDRVNYPQMIATMYENEGLLESYYNMAVSGFRTIDVLKQLVDDISYNENIAYNIVGEYTYKKGLKDYHHTAKLLEHDIKISKLIENSDEIIMTLGSNDYIKFFYTYQDKMSKIIRSSDSDLIKSTTDEVIIQYHQIVKMIKSINPRIKIVLIGSYVPHKSKYVQNLFFDMFKQIEVQIKEDLCSGFSNFHYVSILDGFKENRDEFLDNPLNIHPNKMGYAYMAKQYEIQVGVTNG